LFVQNKFVLGEVAWNQKVKMSCAVFIEALFLVNERFEFLVFH
jgi:hypothetical protein